MSRLHTSLYALTALASMAFACLQPSDGHDPGRDVRVVASALLGQPGALSGWAR